MQEDRIVRSGLSLDSTNPPAPPALPTLAGRKLAYMPGTRPVDVGSAVSAFVEAGFLFALPTSVGLRFGE
jgi:hypothetical protein